MALVISKERLPSATGIQMQYIQYHLHVVTLLTQQLYDGDL